MNHLYRAWHKKENRMYYSGKLDEYNTIVFRPHKKEQMCDQFWWFFEKDLIIMRNTWLKDKNWKEIYEWDILNWRYCNGSIEDGIWIVEMWILSDSDGYCNWDYYCWKCWDTSLLDINTERGVLWNKYQNPDKL